jgi:hypothetical protein
MLLATTSSLQVEEGHRVNQALEIIFAYGSGSDVSQAKSVA